MSFIILIVKRILLAAMFCMVVAAMVANAAQENNTESGLSQRATNQKIIAAVPKHFPPQYAVNESGESSGFAIDIINKVAELANVKLKFVQKNSWAEVGQALLNGEADIIPNLGITPERQQQFAFSIPMETISVSLFVRKKTQNVQGLSGLDGLKVAVVNYNSAEKILQTRSDIELIRFANPKQALSELLSGNVDALAYPEATIKKMLRDLGIEGSIKIVGKPLVEIKRAVAVRKDNSQLLNLFNTALGEFLSSPDYQQIYLRWYSDQPEFWTNYRLKWLIGILLLLSLSSMFGWRYFFLVRINTQLRLETDARKAAETILREREEHIRLLMESTAEAIYGVDIKGNCTFANPSCIRMLGYKDTGQLMGKNMHNLLHHTRADGTTYPINMSKIQQAYQEDRGIHVEDESIWREDGSSFPVEYWSYPIKKNSKVVGAVVTFIDITQRLAAQKALFDSEHRYRTTFDQASVGIAHVSTSGKILHVNPKCHEIFGHSEEELTKLTMQNLIYEQDRTKYERELTMLLSGITLYYTNEKRIKRKNRRVTWVNQTVTLLKDAEGRPQYFVCILQDIDDRKQVEQELIKERANLEEVVEERTRDLQDANKELEAFSYSVSHDLRAPLRSIDGFSLALMEDYSPKLDDNAKEYIARVRKSTRHMGQLIDDMLSLSRVSRHELKQEVINLSEVAEDVSCQLADSDMEREVIFVIKETPAAIGDPTLLHAVLDNLFGNAWKFTRNVENPELEFGHTEHNDQVTYYVRDNGVGFDMRYADKLFGSFNRLHKQEDYEGTGIGLATVARIIKRHGGRVWADSEINHGATFYFTVPVTKSRTVSNNNQIMIS